MNEERKTKGQAELPDYNNTQKFLSTIDIKGFQYFGVGVSFAKETNQTTQVGNKKAINPDQPLIKICDSPVITDFEVRLKEGKSNDDEDWLDHFLHYSKITQRGVLIIAGDEEILQYWRGSSACRREVEQVPPDRLFVYINDTITLVGKPSHMDAAKGHIVWADGSLYEGRLKGGEMHGNGEMTDKDGNKLKGKWKFGECKHTIKNLDAEGSSIELSSSTASAVSPSDSSSDASKVSKSSTVKALDSPRRASVLLVFADSEESPSDEYILDKRDEVRKLGLSAHVWRAARLPDFLTAVRKVNPSIVYMEGPPEGRKWKPLREDREFVEELASCLNADKEWRGSFFNWGPTRQEIVEKACRKYPDNLQMLTWVAHPDSSDIDDIWTAFMASFSLVEDKLELRPAFEQARCDVGDLFGSRVAVAPMQVKQPVTEAKEMRSRQRPSMTKMLQSGLRKVTGKLLTKSKKSSMQFEFQTCLSSTPEVQHTQTKVEVHIETEPPLSAVGTGEINNDSTLDLERNFALIFPEAERDSISFRGKGSLYFSMRASAYAWLRDNHRRPLYFELPLSWGGPCTLRVNDVQLGRCCWFEAVVPASGVYELCDRLRAIACASAAPVKAASGTSINNVAYQAPVSSLGCSAHKEHAAMQPEDRENLTKMLVCQSGADNGNTTNPGTHIVKGKVGHLMNVLPNNATSYPNGYSERTAVADMTGRKIVAEAAVTRDKA